MPLVGTGVCALPSSRGTLRCVWRAKVMVIPRGCESLGETVVGVREPLGVFWGLCRRLGSGLAGSSVAGGSAPTGADSGGWLGPAEHQLWIPFLESCRL